MTYPTHKNYNCVVTTESGKEYYLFSNWLNNSDLNHFTGWECYTGTYRIIIDKNLDIYNGFCYTKKLGNLDTGWDLLPEKIICPNARCTSNSDDLMTRKRKLDVEKENK